MLHKFTAIAFFCVMTLLVTLKHPVLGYCFCVDAYFTGDCVCQLDKETQATTLEPTCPSGCCASVLTDNSSENHSESQKPCDDCTTHLFVDVGDFVWHSSVDVPSDTELPYTPVLTAIETMWVGHGSFPMPDSIRGDPPPLICQYSSPIYLRHRVLRL